MAHDNLISNIYSYNADIPGLRMIKYRLVVKIALCSSLLFSNTSYSGPITGACVYVGTKAFTYGAAASLVVGGLIYNKFKAEKTAIATGAATGTFVAGGVAAANTAAITSAITTAVAGSSAFAVPVATAGTASGLLTTLVSSGNILVAGTEIIASTAGTIASLIPLLP